MYPGSLALGLGRGLQGAAQAVPFFAQLKQQALQNAMAQRRMDFEEQRAKAQEAAQATAQLPGGVEVSPAVYHGSFEGTPSAARFLPPQNVTDIVNKGQSPEGPNFQPQAPAMPSQNYQTNEPFNQFKAILAAQTSANNAQLRANTSLATNANTNQTRAKIAQGVQTIAAARNTIMQQLGQERNAQGRARLQQQLQHLMIQEQALKLAGAKAEWTTKAADARIENSQPYQNAILMNSLGLGEYPSGFDTSGVDKEIDEILKGLPNLQAPAAPGAAPAPKGKIVAIEPMK